MLFQTRWKQLLFGAVDSDRECGVLCTPRRTALAGSAEVANDAPMPAPIPIPRQLHQDPFSTAQALGAGLSRKRLDSKRFQLLVPGRGIWAVRGGDRSTEFWLAADRLMLPDDAAVSYTTGLNLYGAEVGGWKRHWTTTGAAKVRTPGVILHRRRHAPVHLVGDFPVLSPLQCLLASALVLSTLELVRAGDALLTAELVDLEELRTVSGVYGAKRLRAAAQLMRVGAESARESSTRLMVGIGGLPEPLLNQEVWDGRGAKLGRPDLLFERFGVTGEYDGWYHERSAENRQTDIIRLENMRRAGLLPVVLTSKDHDNPPRLLHRLWQALEERGYDGPRPRFDWQLWARLQRQPHTRS